jgi:hypothetical protein
MAWCFGVQKADGRDVKGMKSWEFRACNLRLLRLSVSYIKDWEKRPGDDIFHSL